MAALSARGIAGAAVGCLAACAAAAWAWAEGSGALRFEPPTLDLGTVREGQTAQATLRLRNASDRLVVLGAIETSCGCTVAEPADRVLPPGGFTAVRVRIDTFGKRGAVQKQIVAYDDRGQPARAVLRLRVVAGDHAAIAGRSLFDAKCARCHAEPARGLRDGGAIYRAVCAMCHGEEGKGGHAPALSGLPAEAVVEVLREGIDHRMPAFVRTRGGPLDAAQIEAVARWLAGRHPAP